jgi:hypothetical protein
MRKLIFFSPVPDVPWFVSLFIIVITLLLLGWYQAVREPVFMKDCMDAGYTQAQCEMQWKWGRLR